MAVFIPAAMAAARLAPFAAPLIARGGTAAMRAGPWAQRAAAGGGGAMAAGAALPTLPALMHKMPGFGGDSPDPPRTPFPQQAGGQQGEDPFAQGMQGMSLASLGLGQVSAPQVAGIQLTPGMKMDEASIRAMYQPDAGVMGSFDRQDELIRERGAEAQDLMGRQLEAGQEKLGALPAEYQKIHEGVQALMPEREGGGSRAAAASQARDAALAMSTESRQAMVGLMQAGLDERHATRIGVLNDTLTGLHLAVEEGRGAYQQALQAGLAQGLTQAQAHNAGVEAQIASENARIASDNAARELAARQHNEGMKLQQAVAQQESAQPPSFQKLSEVYQPAHNEITSVAGHVYLKDQALQEAVQANPNTRQAYTQAYNAFNILRSTGYDNLPNVLQSLMQQYPNYPRVIAMAMAAGGVPVEEDRVFEQASLRGLI